MIHAGAGSGTISKASGAAAIGARSGGTSIGASSSLQSRSGSVSTDLGYRGGQEPIAHLELDLQSVVTWADANGRRWSFTLSNAGAAYAEFRSRLDQLGDLNWTAIRSTDFSSPTVKEGKQAEFLVKDFVPWELVVRIGVHSPANAARVAAAISATQHQPRVEVLPGWYY